MSMLSVTFSNRQRAQPHPPGLPLHPGQPVGVLTARDPGARIEPLMTKAFMLKPLSFEDAVRLFKQWGFQVEPGPRPEEVTLILEGPGHRTYAVYEPQLTFRHFGLVIQ
jgi:hypothetical protein